MDALLWLMVALLLGFLGYVLYARQVRWLLGVIRNMVLGIIGMLLLNTLLADMGISVGINLITTLLVGLLGMPGFLILYATQILLG